MGCIVWLYSNFHKSTRIFSPPCCCRGTKEIELWIKQPNTLIVRETNEHWTIFRELLETTGAAGNLTTDAHLASLAIAHGAVMISCDSDFSRFKSLRWFNPLQ
jgi:uncharacterized protein